MSLLHGTRGSPGHAGVAVRSHDHVRIGAARRLSDADERAFDSAEGGEGHVAGDQKNGVWLF